MTEEFASKKKKKKREREREKAPKKSTNETNK